MNRRLNNLRRWIPLAAIPAALILAALNAKAQQATPMAPDRTAPQVYGFTLKEALDYGAKNNMKVKNALLDYQIQQESNRATVSAALPQISGGAGFYRLFSGT